MPHLVFVVVDRVQRQTPSCIHGTVIELNTRGRTRRREAEGWTSVIAYLLAEMIGCVRHRPSPRVELGAGRTGDCAFRRPWRPWCDLAQFEWLHVAMVLFGIERHKLALRAESGQEEVVPRWKHGGSNQKNEALYPGDMDSISVCPWLVTYRELTESIIKMAITVDSLMNSA